MEDLLSPKAVAELLSLDRKTVYRAIDRGELRAYRIGTALRVAPSAVEEWLERSVA